MTDITQVIKAIEAIEGQLSTFADKSAEEIKAVGAQSADTAAAIEALGVKQRELADDLLYIKQRGTPLDRSGDALETWGDQLVKTDSFKGFAAGSTNKVRIAVKNTITGADATVAPDRKPGVVSGAFQPLTLESFLISLPTTSNAIEFTRENTFTNAAAETAEGVAKPESAVTFTLVKMPVSTVAHWVKISRQLAMDNAALAAYVDLRMRYGVNLRVEAQLVAGNGSAPNISGILDTGNFTAHGYADAALGSTLKKLVLIRKAMADLWNAGYPADGILLNPADWATIEIDLFTTAAGQVRSGVNAAGQQTLFGVPVIQSPGVTADTVAVGAFRQGYTVHNREDVVVEMSDSDSDNFTKNLVTIRAERRLALATERPAACRAGDLTPA